jgi:tripeptidyl-peptidase-1
VICFKKCDAAILEKCNSFKQIFSFISERKKMMKKLISLGVVVTLFSGEVSALRTNGWTKHTQAPGEMKVKVTLPIKQSNLELVEKLFWEVSNPKSSMYGKYMSFDEIGELTKNENATLSTVEYLKSVGVRESDIRVNPHGTFVSAVLPVSVANKAFNADFYVYSHPESSDVTIKTEISSLPGELAAYVTHVAHASYFPEVFQKVKIVPQLGVGDSSLAAAASNANYVTPNLLVQHYRIDQSQVSHGATQSLFEALGQQFDNKDLNQFQKQFGLKVQDITNIVGKDVPADCFKSTGADSCGEANLDVQYIMAVAQGALTTYWNIDASSNDPFLDWVEQLSYHSTLPQVHSISYGGYEDTSNNDMKTFNTEVQKLGLRGITVLVSSGDDGAANSQARNDASKCGYYASFPASSPYVTAVGATQGPESGKPEIACSSKTGGVITSGGGFSDVFSRPSYQNSHVSAYFKAAPIAAKSGYNANGRAYPDVSVMGYNYVLAIGGQFTLESGTSASAPVFAGMITLINDARLAKGKAPLGFLNQALYSLESSVFNDIVTGNNKCTAGACCSEGFYAAKGWDPVTGLGTPNFTNLKQALLAL